MEYKKIVRAILSNRKTPLREKINLIKHNVNSGHFKEALGLNPLFKNFLTKSPYFESLSDIYIKEPLHFSEDLKIEFRWLAGIIENHFEDLNQFLSLKNDFENHLIKDDFKQSKKILEKIESKFGISLWSIEANLLIEDRTNGNEANWSKLSYYLGQIKNPIYELIINSSSKRVESKMSFESFLNQFQNDIDNINATGIIEDFFVFKNFNYPHYEYSYGNLEGVFYVANVFSVIDQYLVLMDAIVYNIHQNTVYDKFYQVFLRSAKKVIKNDSRVNNLYNLLNDKEDFDEFYNNDLFNSCVDSYYIGNFEDSLKFSKQGLDENPLEFQYYEVYCKSLINLKREFQPLGISKTSDDILNSVYRLFSFEKDEKENFTYLLNTALHFMNTNFGKQIYSLLSELEGTNDRHYIRGLSSASYSTYKFLYFYKKRGKSLTNLSSLINTHAFKVNSFKLGFDIDFTDSISNSPEQTVIFKAIRSYNLGDYDNVISSLTENDSLNGINYYYERKIDLLFKSYLKTDLLKEALVLFGQVFFHESLDTRKIKSFELFEKISRNHSNEELEGLIEYPILISLHEKEYDLYEVFDDFLFFHNIEELASIDTTLLFEKFGDKKSIYFLENITTIDTIKYSSDYSSISEVEEDRIAILNKLIEINPNDKINYEKEINEIYRINSVRKVLKEVDEGRLYIDVDNLKKKQIKKFNDDFRRFKEIEQSSSVQSLIGFNASNKQNWNALLSGSKSGFDTFNSAEYLAFKSIYLESRENFLFSKEHGLDSSLSTRIRHGALKNHIRSVFEKLDLVTSKLNNEYKDNLVWKQQLKDHYLINLKVQEILKNFSKQIDDYTLFLVEKVIQIQTEKTKNKEDGVFTFFTNDSILFNFYMDNRHTFDSTETIIEMLLTNLVNHTLIGIQKDIIAKFEGEIWLTFQGIIEEAVSQLRELKLPSNCELVPNLIKSGTETQKELEVISDWFYLNTSNSSTLLSIETVIDASIELTNNINPNFLINPKVNLNCTPFGVYSSLIFVFNILFNNVISHSRLKPEEAKIEVDIDLLEEKYFRISFSNNLKSKIDYSQNIRRLNRVKDNWNDHSNIDRSNKEGESGFDKIKRILIYETLSKTDKFEFSLEENTISINLFFPYVKFNTDE